MGPYLLNQIRILILPLILFQIAASANLANSAPHNTPKYWKCYNRVGGSWQFGHAPSACDALEFLDVNFAQNVYNEVIYNDSSHGRRERKRYMGEVFPVLRDFAKYYIKRRNPNVSNEELNAWGDAVYAVAHQESFWTHYRKSNNSNLKVMRGDHGHGHGIMQVDDRWHFPAVKNGTAWDLLKNLSYALDIYYSAWLKAPRARCLNSNSNWKNRTKAAYSAYNGGHGSICRWTNPNNRWARNDNGFLTKYLEKQWEDYVSDMNAAAPFNPQCVFEGNGDCGDGPTPIEGSDTPRENVIYKTSDNKVCIYEDDKFQCLDAFTKKNTICLYNHLSNPLHSNNRFVALTSSMLDRIGFDNVDDEELCSPETLDRPDIGDSIVLLKSIKLRSTPAGRYLHEIIPSGTTVQVLDIEMKDHANLLRYYFVKYGSRYGYIYGGDKEDYDQWAELTHGPANETRIIPEGELLRITNPYGINLRNKINGRILTAIPKGVRLEVMETKVIPDTKKVYYKLSYRGEVGYIYGGRIMPKALTDNLRKWAVPVN